MLSSETSIANLDDGIGMALTAGKIIAARALASVYLGARLATLQPSRERRTGRRAIPILNLHRVATFRPEHPMTLSPAVFRTMLSGLQKSFRFVSLETIDDILRSGRNTENIAGLTFDDCYGCNYAHALPILRSLKIPATFFVSSGFVDSTAPFPHDARDGFLDLPNFTSSQLREMAADPLFSIGSHTISHHDFSKPTRPETAAREIGESKQALERICGREVTRFATPWGHIPHCTPQVIAAARAAGYLRVYAHFAGRNLVCGDGRLGYVLHRICSSGTPGYVRACLESYRGRSSFLPGATDQSSWPAEFHPNDIRRL